MYVAACVLNYFCNIVPNCDQQKTHMARLLPYLLLYQNRHARFALTVAIPGNEQMLRCSSSCWNPSGGVVTKEKTHDRETPWFGVCTDEEVLGTYVTALYMYTVKKS